ncbi:MAG: hypothetical protein FWB96_03705 [Defluviitaleaceae bacterium]|nr:hypothetical protein [Defluviitaleaceae bacterium]MCL2262142.1 hypothetical protein [Defluviitaleaceae bacterium]
MGDLSTILPSYFGFSGAKAVKERGAYLFDSAKIHKSNSTPREIIASFDLLKKIEQAGFLYADVIIESTQKTPFVTLGRDIFVATRYVRGREPDMACLDDVKALTQSLAGFHKAARDLKNLSAEISRAPSLCDVFAKQIATLGASVKQVNRRPRLSDFDVLVLKNADAFTARAEKAAEILSATDYKNMYENAIANNHICHAALKEETFTLTQEHCYISRFEDATIDLQLTDLASLLRRYARKSGREMPIKTLLEIYNKTSPLPADAEKIIHAMLLFPWPFLKTVSQFYSKKRNFIPAAITTRMTGILEEQEEYDKFIKS